MAGMSSLDALFEDELRDLYDAERQIIKALPRMIKATENDELRDAFEAHLEETRGHVERLEQVFAMLDLRVRGKHCSGMAGILEEGANLLTEDGDEAVLDAGYIAAAQRVEHYEITAYGTLIAWATTLGHENVTALLEQTLNEEKAADQKLSALAETSLNELAARSDAETGVAESRAPEREAKPRTRTAGRR
jgi:ferritin-like metal-binding protein YciE